MSWGEAFRSAYRNASDAAREAADNVASGAAWVGNQTTDAARSVADRAVESAQHIADVSKEVAATTVSVARQSSAQTRAALEQAASDITSSATRAALNARQRLETASEQVADEAAALAKRVSEVADRTVEAVTEFSEEVEAKTRARLNQAAEASKAAANQAVIVSKDVAAKTRAGAKSAYAATRKATVQAAKATNQAVKNTYNAAKTSVRKRYEAIVPPPIRTCPKNTSGGQSGDSASDISPGSYRNSQEPPPPPCCNRTLTAICGHGERKFHLERPAKLGDPAGSRLIQLVADTADQDTLTVNFDDSLCPQGNGPAMPGVFCDGKKVPLGTAHGLAPGQVAKANDNTLSYYLHTLLEDPTSGHEGVSVYNYDVHACGDASSYGFSAEVFPKWEWKLKASAGLATNLSEDEAQKGADDTYEVSFKGSAHTIFGRNEKKTEIGYGYSFDGTFWTFLTKLKKFLPIDGISVEGPVFELSGGKKLVEVEGSYLVDTQGTIGISFSPLIGITGAVDITEAILKMFGPKGVAIVEAKKRVKKGIGPENFKFQGDIGVDFISSGKVGLAFEYVFNPGRKTNSASGKCTLDLEFSVKGHSSAKMTLFILEFGGGAYIEGKSGVGGEIYPKYTGGGIPALKGKAIFKGLTIERCTYVEAQVKFFRWPWSGANKKANRKSGRKNENIGYKSEVIHSMEILPKAEWPKFEETSIAQSGDL